MNQVTANLSRIRARIEAAERRFARAPGSVALLAVSKTQPPEAVAEALAAGQHAFGENQLQDAMTKIAKLGGSGGDHRLEWHFIGPVQSNKTRAIAQHFDWVHSLERSRIARRLSEQRDPARGPLNVCIQVNVSGEASKSGIDPEQAVTLARDVRELPHLRLRGLMAVPAPAEGLDAQRAALRPLAELLGKLRTELADGAQALDTLSMGMSDDLEAAVAEGATLVRIGTGVFGPRRR